MTVKRTAWVGSLWHQFNEPFVGVAGVDRAIVEAELNRNAEEEYKQMVDATEANDPEPDDDIMTGGLFFDEVEMSDTEAQEFDETGLVYLNVQ